MSSTNKTTNYELSQFIGADKPAWLGDYNTDMSKIDTQMKANADAATAASGSATSANTAIGTLSSLTTDAKTDLVSAINEVDGHADTAQNTATNAATTANGNATKITSLENYLNINTFTTPEFTISGGTERGTSSFLNCASNNTGTLGKVYGRIVLDHSSSTTTVSFATPFRPDSTITINGIVYSQWSDTPTNASSYSNILNQSIEIASNGTATIDVSNSATSGRTRVIWIDACLLFFKSFGDVPAPED